MRSTQAEILHLCVLTSPLERMSGRVGQIVCVPEAVSVRCGVCVCVCVCVCEREREREREGERERERGGGREAEGTRLGEGRGINHAKSNLAPWEFIRIELKSMGSFMRQFSSRWLWGLFELSSSLGWLWLTAPPVLTPVHEAMCIFHARSRELTHLERLPPRQRPGLLPALPSSSDRSISREVRRCVRRGGTKGWVMGALGAVRVMPGA